MADYYTHFSCLLDVGTSDNVSHALVIFEVMKSECFEACQDLAFDVSCQPGSIETLWIRDDHTGEPEHVIDFVRRCAEATPLRGLWGFQWANTCTAAKLNAFGGGAHLIDLATGESVGYVDTHDWLTLNTTRPEATS